jgi:hypothetical protein
MKIAAPLLLACLMLPSTAGAADTDAASGTSGPLFDTVAALDRTVFDAYNRCDLETFATYFVPDVEFYHDNGGVTWTRADVVEGTRKYICGKVRRELIPGTLRIYPIKDFGAVEEGEHRFCQRESGQCEGVAKFVMVWRREGEAWRMTRVLSYGHRAATEEEMRAAAAAQH